MSAWFNYVATLKILVFGLLIGAALPATVRRRGPGGRGRRSATR